MSTIEVISPIDQSLYTSIELATPNQIEQSLTNAKKAQKDWQKTNLETRQQTCLQMLEYFKSNQADIGKQITEQMGRPIRYAAGEINGFIDRAEKMINIAMTKLQPIHMNTDDGQDQKWIERTPLGTVFCVTPWNYPFLTAVNSIVPAIMAGNAVIMKPASQTPLVATVIQAAFDQAGLPKGVFQHLFLNHEQTKQVIQSNQINYISFTGSVPAGKLIEQQAAGNLIDMSLELGGKDPAYVRSDADVVKTAEQLVDGAFFNSGQSCCGIERIYVDHNIFDAFVEQFVTLTKEYQLGNPLDESTTLGPMASVKAAKQVQAQIDQAIQSGAKAWLNPSDFNQDISKGLLAPQVLTHVNHDMAILQEETFGPVVTIMATESDEQATDLMNDSDFGLTASIWTKDTECFKQLAKQIETGTCFMNRCDYLDPMLCWNGVKQTGKGGSLSEIGYERLTRPKSFYLRPTLD